MKKSNIIFGFYGLIITFAVMTSFVGCKTGQMDIANPGLKPPEVFYSGTIITIEKRDNGYLLYTNCPVDTPWDENELVPMWVTDQTYVDPELMQMIEKGEAGGVFYAGIYNLSGILPDRVVKQVVFMNVVDESP